MLRWGWQWVVLIKGVKPATLDATLSFEGEGNREGMGNRDSAWDRDLRKGCFEKQSSRLSSLHCLFLVWELREQGMLKEWLDERVLRGRYCLWSYIYNYRSVTICWNVEGINVQTRTSIYLYSRNISSAERRSIFDLAIVIHRKRSKDHDYLNLYSL